MCAFKWFVYLFYAEKKLQRLVSAKFKKKLSFFLPTNIILVKLVSQNDCGVCVCVYLLYAFLFVCFVFYWCPYTIHIHVHITDTRDTPYISYTRSTRHGAIAILFIFLSKRKKLVSFFLFFILVVAIIEWPKYWW